LLASWVFPKKHIPNLLGEYFGGGAIGNLYAKEVSSKQDRE